tara:strand:- start:71 stop:325 length:255 start_codon:yes stop_codon:yes gene_type:complete
MEQREPYWDYMGRRLREEVFDKQRGQMSMDDMWKREIKEMQNTVHHLQIRVKELSERVQELSKKVTVLGGDPNQLELEFDNVTR